MARAYTDCIAQALPRMWQEITSPIFCCGFGRAASLQAAGGTLSQVQHAAHVEMTFTLPEPAAASLAAKLNEACHGQMHWLEVDEAV